MSNLMDLSGRVMLGHACVVCYPRMYGDVGCALQSVKVPVFLVGHGRLGMGIADVIENGCGFDF